MYNDQFLKSHEILGIANRTLPTTACLKHAVGKPDAGAGGA
jgi:hypothetical protein